MTTHDKIDLAGRALVFGAIAAFCGLGLVIGLDLVSWLVQASV